MYFQMKIPIFCMLTRYIPIDDKIIIAIIHDTFGRAKYYLDYPEHQYYFLIYLKRDLSLRVFMCGRAIDFSTES